MNRGETDIIQNKWIQLTTHKKKKKEEEEKVPDLTRPKQCRF